MNSKQEKPTRRGFQKFLEITGVEIPAEKIEKYLVIKRRLNTEHQF